MFETLSMLSSQCLCYRGDIGQQAASTQQGDWQVLDLTAACHVVHMSEIMCSSENALSSLKVFRQAPSTNQNHTECI